MIANILFFIFYSFIQKQFPRTFKKLKLREENESKEDIYKELGKDIYDKIEKKRKLQFIENKKF
jgi:predicted DNA-binding protein YlxM (UPF0122 family)